MITKNKEVEAAAVRAEALHNAIFNSTHFSSITTDDKGVIQIFNVGAERMLGYTAAEVINTFTPTDIFDAQELIARAETLSDELDTPIATGFEALIYKASRSVEDISELTYIRKDGSRFEAVVSVTSLRDAQDVIIGYLLIGTNNTARDKAAKAHLQLAAGVFTHSREGIIITDDTATIIDVNHAFIQITGYSREEAIGQNPSFLHSGKQGSEFYADMWQELLKEGYWSGEVWNRRKNGEVYAVMKTISAVRDERGVTTHYVSLANDITPMKAHQDQLEHIAHYDILTNLPNRVLLADRLSQAMLQCRRHGQLLAVVFLDLDGFKAVNDAHGHDVGDELLIALSIRMKAALREGDSLARIGGDEFVAVLADLTTIENCKLVLERLLLAASESVTIDDIVLDVSASIGVTLYPQDSVDADQLMRHADQAMYVAKESGKNRYHLFDTVQDDAVKVKQESLEAIRSALDNHQFVLHYQPKVNMKTGTVTGFEALIRWQHPKRGLLNPIDFLPVIENNAMSIEMGEWVIDSALTQISQWQAMRLKLPVSISVNIAAVQLQQPDFTQRLTTLLAAHPDVEPRHLELEVLETSAIDDVHHASTIMNACMELGVNFALDDFGTGYSSLTYLRRLPASLIKIDQSFVRDMLYDTDDLSIVESVIALAKSFKRDVIAEGVETVEHGRALLKLGCDLAQGYGIARPMSASDIPVWIKEWKPDDSWMT
jgi:diguanylate cyclase (GGDEF)-like protein/PAS domain S-box-containing protein